MGRAPGLVDVAKAAGVSHMTVSRVLNNHAMVKPETRERVLAAVEALGYRRNSLAQAFKGQRTATLGVVLAGDELYELARILRGIEGAARAQGYWVTMAAWHGGSVDDLTETFNRLIDQSVDGIVLVADRPLALEALQDLQPRVPVVAVMSGTVRNASIGSVEIDQAAGARTLTRHLLGLGHRRVAHLSGPPRVHDARARITGWRTALRAAGVEAGPLLEGDFTPESGYALAQELLGPTRSGLARPTAVFAANDHMAVGVLNAFAEAGISVPGDFSLVGFDDVRGSSHLVPPLTTVRQDFALLGSSAIELLFEVLAGAPPRRLRLPPELIVRRSSAAPVAARAR